MARFLMIALAAALLVAIALAAKSCSQTSPMTAGRAVDLSPVVALPNGAVMTAPKGTVGRELIDWLDSTDRTERRFELGGKQFDGRSIEPTIESKVRIQRAIVILKAHRDVQVRLIGYTAATGNPSADLNLSQARARWAVDALADGGITRSRLSPEDHGGADPIGDNRTPEGRARNERLVMILWHRR